MAFDREAAKAEGYTDDEINAYLQAEAEKAKQPAPPVTDVGEPPAPQTRINPVGTSPEAVATAGGLAVAPYVLPAAAAGAAALGGSKLYGAWNASAEAAKALADAQMQTEAGRANRAQMKAAPQQVRPVSPTPTYNVPTANTPQMRAPLPTAPVAPPGMAAPAGPVAPAGMAAPARTPGIMERMRALAANKVLQGAGNLAKGSVGPGMAMYSGGLNTNEEEELRRRRMMPPTITR